MFSPNSCLCIARGIFCGYIHEKVYLSAWGCQNTIDWGGLKVTGIYFTNKLIEDVKSQIKVVADSVPSESSLPGLPMGCRQALWCFFL